jgi:hypothetical protein
MGGQRTHEFAAAGPDFQVGGFPSQESLEERVDAVVAMGRAELGAGVIVQVEKVWNLGMQFVIDLREELPALIPIGIAELVCQLDLKVVVKSEGIVTGGDCFRGND